jgi:hypothetical protein
MSTPTAFLRRSSGCSPPSWRSGLAGAIHVDESKPWGGWRCSSSSSKGSWGGLRVVMLRDAIGIFHASLAQVFLVLLACPPRDPGLARCSHGLEQQGGRRGNRACRAGGQQLGLERCLVRPCLQAAHHCFAGTPPRHNHSRSADCLCGA